MKKKPIKPQGLSGPVSIGPEGIQWHINQWPEDKEARETLVAEAFAAQSDRFILQESEPTFRPFTNLKHNPENDLDFTIQTPHGPRLLELAEIAPLKEFGSFESVPSDIPASRTVKFALELIGRKSAHQGGPNRHLLLYATEHAFKLNSPTVEAVRVELAGNPPAFERVYYVSVKLGEAAGAMIWELYPGEPHPWHQHEIADEAHHSIHPKGLLSKITDDDT